MTIPRICVYALFVKDEPFTGHQPLIKQNAYAIVYAKTRLAVVKRYPEYRVLLMSSLSKKEQAWFEGKREVRL